MLARRQHLVVARDEPHRDFTDRVGRTERAHERVQPVVARQRRQAEIGNDEPLRCGRGILGALAVGRRGDHEIDARRQIRHCVAHRDRRRHFLIEAVGEFQLALPDALSRALADRLQLVGLHLLEEAIERRRAGKPAIADTQDLDLGFRRVDRNDRNALLAAVRQNIGAAGETHARGAVADVDGDLGGFRQRLADRRRKTGAELHLIALAVLEAVDAELLTFDRQVLRLAPVDSDEFLEIADAPDSRSEKLMHRRGSAASDSVL